MTAQNPTPQDVPTEDTQTLSGFKKLLSVFDVKRYRYHMRYDPTSIWSYVVESTVLRSVGWIPGLMGALVRNVVYRPLFAQLGTLAFIETGVELKSTGSISLGKRTVVQGNVHLNGWHLDSSIDLKEFAYLDRGVNITVHEQGHIEIGPRTYVGPYTCIAGPGPVSIGKQCLISSHCGIYGNNHVFDDPNAYIRKQGFTCKGIVIEDDCWLGTGVRVLDGVTVGYGSVIGAGAVVTKDIPPYSIAVGIPARVIGQRGPSDPKPDPNQVIAASV